MATAGMGDVLTGVIAGLQAQGMNALSSACAGSWICGRTAEVIVSSRKQSTQSLIATDLLDNLGEALNEWQRGE
jgi:NAD(P)H-hydrate epimerase